MMFAALCRECSAGIYFVPMAGAGVGASSHPVDMIEVVTPMVGLLAFNPETGRAAVLRGEDLPRAQRWLEDGRVRLYRSHFASCPGAQKVREHNPDQEKMDV